MDTPDLSIRISQTTQALTDITALWPDGFAVLQIHNLPHSLMHQISGHLNAVRRPKAARVEGEWFLVIAAKAINGRSVDFFGEFDLFCESCCALAGIPTAVRADEEAEANRILAAS